MDDAAYPPLVTDQVTGRTARLMYVGVWRDPGTRREHTLAFLRPERGGREWAVDPGYVLQLDAAQLDAAQGAS